MLTPAMSVVVIVDVQGKLAQLMHEKEVLFENLQKLIRGARSLDVPIVWMEQNPQGLGPTIPEIARWLPDLEPIPKLSFSCCGCEAFLERLSSLGRKQVVIAGIEAHVCVYQTVADLRAMGYEVAVVADAVSSRTPENKRIGLERIRDLGGAWTSVEMLLFEWLRIAQGPRFKEVLQIIK